MYDPYTLGLNPKAFLGSSRDRLLVFCPFHKDNHASAVFDMKTGKLYCFTCHRVFDIKDIISVTGGFINNIFTRNLEFDETSIESVVNNITHKNLAIGNSYLHKRGLSDETIQHFGILQDNSSVYFPVRNHAGKNVGYVSRKYKNFKGTRYINYFDGEKPKFFDMSALLDYNRNKPLYIVENLFAVPRGFQAGKQVVSTFGSSVNTKNFSMWVRDFNKIIILYDNDAAGFRAYKRIKSSCFCYAAFPVKSSDELENDEWDNLRITFDLNEIKEYMK